MYETAAIVVPAMPPAGTLLPMRKPKADKRYFVKLADETKRRLDFLAVDAGADSTEAFGGQLLTEVIDRLWKTFDPHKPKPPAKGGRR